MAGSKDLTETHSRISFFKENPVARAVSTKLVYGRGAFSRPTFGSMADFVPNVQALGKISARTSQSMTDVENIFEVLPDTELAMQILVSSILSPNDLRRPQLSWSVEDCQLDSTVTTALLDIVRDYFEKDYKIKEMLPEMLQDALFWTGSYPLMVVPESSIEDMINKPAVGMEDYRSAFTKEQTLPPLGLLGDGLAPKSEEKTTRTATPSLESMFGVTPEVATDYKASLMFDDKVKVTDNFGAVRIPELVKKLRKARVRDRVYKGSDAMLRKVGAAVEGLGLEEHGLSLTPGVGGKKMTNAQVSHLFYKSPSNRSQQVVRVPTGAEASRASIGHPLAMKLPSDSVIPVHVPSNPSEHIGYFILLDEFGNPLSNAKQSDYYRELSMSKWSKETKSATTRMIEQIRTSTYGGRCSTDLDQASIIELYTRAVEQDLVSRLRRGIYGEDVEIAHTDEVYRIMMARSLANKNTQLLFVPAELMTYVAFDYNQFGVGKSLLEKNKILASIRAILLFANTMAAIKNSVNRRSINIDLDPEDVEPDSTVEMIMTEMARVQSAAFPLATTHPLDIVDGLRNAATSVNVTGNPNYPETKVGVEDLAGSRVLIDDQLDESMRDRYMMGLGITPELIDTTANVEFAAQIVSSNAMLAKRLAIYQEGTGEFTKDHVVKYTTNSGKLMVDMIKVIVEIHKNDRDRIESAVKDAREAKIVSERNPDLDWSVTEQIEHFLDCLKIELPAPDSSKLQNQLEMFNTYAQGLDQLLPTIINERVLEIMMGDDARDYVEPMIEMAKGYYLRKFMAENNIMPELQDLVSTAGTEEEPLDLLEKHTEHANGLAVVMKKLIERIRKKNGVGVDDDATGADSWGADTSSDGAVDDSFSDSDDLSMPDDTEMEEEVEEEPIEEETPAEEPPEDETQEEPEEQ